MVFYRKYRPQTIDDLDSSAVREALYSVLKKSATHAFLFTGPKGLGKTSTARIIAKAVNCLNKKKGEVEPCNACEQCLSITNGTNLDVLEIDAASNRGIDEIRDLKEKIRLAPVSAKIKVYIIDEVHMLTTEAFNALLKTLEEPPSHAMFILCTTEPQKIPATIISRCFHMTFKPATEDELVRSFTRIVKAEKIDIENEALKYIAGFSDRGFRDGAKILEEVMMLADGKTITRKLIEEKYQVSGVSHLVSDMLEALVKRDLKKGLEIVAKLEGQGADFRYFLQLLLEMLHENLLAQVGIQNAKYEQETKFDISEIKKLFELLTKAAQDIKSAIVPQLPLELAIIDYCQHNSEAAVKKTTPPSVKKSTDVTVSTLRKQVGDIKKNEALYGIKKQEEQPESAIKTATVELMHAAPNGDVTDEWLAHFWEQLIYEIKQHNHTIAGVLRGARIKSFDKKLLIIEASYKFHKERLDDIKTRELLLKIAKSLTGKDVEIKVELGSKGR